MAIDTNPAPRTTHWGADAPWNDTDPDIHIPPRDDKRSGWLRRIFGSGDRG